MAASKKVKKPELPEPPLAWVVDPVRLKKARADAALTQFDVAILAGISPRAVSRLETGSDVEPSLVAAGRIADVLNVDLRWLCNRPKLPNPLCPERGPSAPSRPPRRH